MSRQTLPAPGTLAIRAVAFDMDGLLIDSERLDRDLWQSVARQRGLDLPDAVHASLIGLREPDSQRRLAEHFGADADLGAMRAEVGEQWEHHALHGGYHDQDWRRADAATAGGTSDSEGARNLQLAAEGAGQPWIDVSSHECRCMW